RVPAGPGEAEGQTELDRIFVDSKGDGNRRCCRLGGKHRGRGERGDDGNAAANQLGRQARQSIVIILRRAVFDRYILALDIASVLEALTESAQTIHARVEHIGVEKSDYRHCRLLPGCRERPREGRAAECSQQFPPSDGDCHTPLPCEVRKTQRYHATSVLSVTARHPARARQGPRTVNAAACSPPRSW